MKLLIINFFFMIIIRLDQDGEVTVSSVASIDEYFIGYDEPTSEILSQMYENPDRAICFIDGPVYSWNGDDYQFIINEEARHIVRKYYKEMWTIE